MNDLKDFDDLQSYNCGNIRLTSYALLWWENLSKQKASNIKLRNIIEVRYISVNYTIGMYHSIYDLKQNNQKVKNT